MHPLMKTTRRTLANNPSAQPEGADYDFAAGLWVLNGGALCDDPRQMPASKKNDLETGEDQKGQ
jgi:hypothetical protein